MSEEPSEISEPAAQAGAVPPPTPPVEVGSGEPEQGSVLPCPSPSPQPLETSLDPVPPPAGQPVQPAAPPSQIQAAPVFHTPHTYHGQQQTVNNNYYNYESAATDPKGPEKPASSGMKTRARKVGSIYQAHIMKFYSGKPPQDEDDDEDEKNGADPKEAQEESGAFKDPLVPLPQRPSLLRSFQLDIGKKIEQELQEQRIIVVSSARQELSIAASYSLIESRHFSNHRKRALIPHMLSDTSQVSIDLLIRPEYHGCRQEIILVDIDRAGLFLDSIRNLSVLQAGLIRDSLQSRDAFVICSLRTQSPQESSDSLFHWQVDFLPFALYRDFSRDEAQELWKSLEEQWESRLWGSVREDFHQEVWGYLQKGPIALLQEMERRKALKALSLSESLDQIQLIKARDVFRPDSVVHAVVIFIGVYFPGLRPQDFDTLVRRLLGGDTTTIEEGELRPNGQPRWVDLWEEASDRILSECRLEGVLQGDGTHAIELTDPYLRKEFRVYLERNHPVFILRTFDHLRQLRLLFAPDVSGAIVERLIRLSVERTIIDRAYCGTEWLLHCVVHVAHDLAAPVGSMSEARARLGLRKLFDDRLSQLIREMLQHPLLRETVREFLENLLEVDPEITQELLFGLLDRLRFEPQYQGLVWIRSFVDRMAATSHGDLRTKVYNRLVAFTLSSGSRAYSLLAEIASWFPRQDLAPQEYSISGGMALRLLGDYFFYSLGQLPSESRGEWPSRYDLFVSLTLDPTTTAEQIRRLAVWLTHPGMKKILADNPELLALEKDQEQLFLIVIAYFVEEWLLILEGIGSQKPAREASALADQLLQAVATRLTEDQRRKLVRGWQTGQQGYIQQINLLPVSRRMQREQLQIRRRKLLELQQRFQRLPTDRGTARRRDKS